MRHEKTVSVSKIKPLWEPWEEDETPRKNILGGGAISQTGMLFFTKIAASIFFYNGPL